MKTNEGERKRKSKKKRRRKRKTKDRRNKKRKKKIVGRGRRMMRVPYRQNCNFIYILGRMTFLPFHPRYWVHQVTLITLDNTNYMN